MLTHVFFFTSLSNEIDKLYYYVTSFNFEENIKVHYLKLKSQSTLVLIIKSPYLIITISFYETYSFWFLSKVKLAIGLANKLFIFIQKGTKNSIKRYTYLSNVSNIGTSENIFRFMFLILFSKLYPLLNIVNVHNHKLHDKYIYITLKYLRKWNYLSYNIIIRSILNNVMVHIYEIIYINLTNYVLCKININLNVESDLYMAFN